ncbi:FAS-associated death domain protein-like [Babylonia areolata]|uniref:FAS-associated death domain protein-like n=1 Tax=Babylonia areolata TaxID=304850 RepID=UPI003FD17BB9
MAVDHHGFAYRDMLISLDKLISPQELSAMKFYCKDAGIGEKNMKGIQTSLDLWGKLEERKLLARDDFRFLKKLLSTCTDNRRDVIDVVEQFESSPLHSNVANQNGSIAGQEDLRKEIGFLMDNLGRDWKFFMRALGVTEAKLEMCIDSHPRNVKEQIHMAFSECSSGLKKTNILKALKDVSRNDLHHKISNGMY